MKKYFFLIITFTFYANVFAQGPLAKSEKKMVSKLMKSTVKSLSKSVKGLSEAQANFKATPTSWSIKENIYHLALSEDNLWGWMQSVMAAPANPALRSKITVTDAQLMAGVASRDNKVKTSETFEPKNAKWANLQEGLDYLKTKRYEHADFMRNATADMHSHIAEQGPTGPVDAYQIILILTQHTKRHQAQIEEVKLQPGYPAK